MDYKEKQLEEISERVTNYKPARHAPLYECFVTIISLALTIMFFLFPDMLADGGHGVGGLYDLLLIIMPQWVWAFAFFIAGMLKAVGMLIDIKFLRIAGLTLSTIIYAVFSFVYYSSFPNIGSIIFTTITLFSILSVTEVKRTGLRE